MHPTTQYAHDIVNGLQPACRSEIQACERHLADLERTDWEYVFDPSRADLVFTFFKDCRHVRGPFSGQPIELEPFQQFDFGCLFGWVRKDTGARRFKTGYIRVARGNGKSTEMSGIALYGMCADVCYPPSDPDNRRFETKPEVCCIAVDRGQAEIVWGDARDMALASPQISRVMSLQKTKLSHKRRGGEIKKLSRDVKNKDGGAPCVIIIDEYHDHQSSEVKDKTAYGKGKRTQSLELIITTAGEDAENKPCKREDDIVKQVLSGTIQDETYFGVIREIDDDDDPHDDGCWAKANPMFQHENQYSRELRAVMKSEHDLAYGSKDYSKIRQWLIKRVNRWQADSEHKYWTRAMAKWKASAVPRDAFRELIAKGKAWYGVDLSLSEDLTAEGWVIPLDDGRLAVTAHGFTPRAGVERHEKTDRVPYRQWAEDGWLTVTPGAVIEQSFVEQHLKDYEQANDLDIQSIDYDPAYAHEMRIRLENEGYKTLAVRQGPFSLSAPTKKLRELTLQGKIVHDGSPVLTWCLSNAVEVMDSNGNIKLSKKMKTSSARIDLAAAVINALFGWVVSGGEESAVGTIYDKCGMISMG